MLCPPDGYGEAIVELLVTHRPGAAFKSYHLGEEQLTVEAALPVAPALIGKAPDLVVIGLGTADMARELAPDASVEKLGALLQLLVLKTQARVVLTTVCPAFLPAQARAAAVEFNAGVRLLGATVSSPERVRVLDLAPVVDAFLEAHRRGAGEKRSLHVQPLRLTSTGRVFLSNTVYGLLELDELFAA